jgi:hypothetical protein
VVLSEQLTGPAVGLIGIHKTQLINDLQIINFKEAGFIEKSASFFMPVFQLRTNKQSEIAEIDHFPLLLTLS